MLKTRQSWRTLSALAFFALFALLLAACGGDGDDNTPVPATRTAPPTVDIPPEDTTLTPTPADGTTDTIGTPVAQAADAAEMDDYSLAVDQARGDLASYLSASIAEITVVEDDIAANLADPVGCPLPGEDFIVFEEDTEIEGELTEDQIATLEAEAAADADPLAEEDRDPGVSIITGGEEEDIELPEIEEVTLFYLQYEQTMYPYQYYIWPDTQELIVERCSDEMVDQDTLFVPTANPRGSVADAVRKVLPALGVDPAQGTIDTVQEMVWSDTNLGCPVYSTEEREALAPAFVNGYLVIFDLAGKEYEFHTDAAGVQIIYCAPPPKLSTPQEVIDALMAPDLYEVEVIEDEPPITYNGLDRPATLIWLTYQAFPVGLIGYESEDAAQQAAQAINDPAAAYVFVTGQVVIVLEEPSPEAIAILRGIAEQVRAPINEIDPEFEVEFDEDGLPADETGDAPPAEDEVDSGS